MWAVLKKKMSVIIFSLIIICIFFMAALLFQYYKSVSNRLDIIRDYELQPTTSSDVPSIITLPITPEIKVNDAIAIRTVHQEMFAYITSNFDESKLVYEYTKKFSDKWGKSATNQWHIIPIDPHAKNIVLRFELYTPYDDFFDYKNFIAFGDTTTLIEYITALSLPSASISILAIISGFTTIILISLNTIKKTNAYLLPLGFLLIFIGLWSLGQSQRLYFYLVPRHIDRFIYVVSFFLVPECFFFMLSYFYNGLLKKVLHIATCISACLTFICLLLQLFEVVHLFESFQLLIFNFVFGMLLIVVLTIMKLKSNKTKVGIEFLAFFIIMSVLVLFEIDNFLSGDFTNIAFFIRCVLVILSFYVSIRFIRHNAKRSREYKRIRRKLELSRVYTVTQKMKPHLIHNTLLSIQDLCHTSPMEAVDAIEVFSKYLRSSFDSPSNEKLIPFSKELTYIREYIDVQKICYGDDITYEEELNVTNFSIPPFTLQPLIENAVKHGIRKCVEPGCVKLTTDGVDNYVVITIADDGIGFDSKKIEHNSLNTSTGNVLFRLRHLMGATIEIDSIKNKGTKITISFSLE